jgi:hypothetical protein
LSERWFVIRTLLRWLRSRPRSSLTPSPNGIPRATNKKQTLPKLRRLRPRMTSVRSGNVITTVSGTPQNWLRRLMPLRGRRRRNPSSSFATEESTRERRSCATSSISKQPMPGPTPRAFVRRLKGHRSASAACLTVSPTFPILTHGWFIYVACSRQVPPRRLNHSAPENRKGFICQYKNSLLGRLAASEPRLPSLIDERGAQRATGLQQASANSSERMHITRSGSCPSCAATQSGQKTTTSTPNIISDRCPQIEERHSRL